jgi:pimeloyl-ACP methyl ester carboxylesterase
MAISQRPVSATAFDDRDPLHSGRSRPGRCSVRRIPGHAAPPLLLRPPSSTVTEVEGASHFLMLSQPDIVASVIREAVIASAVNRAA